jgi:transposase-like protein
LPKPCAHCKRSFALQNPKRRRTANRKLVHERSVRYVSKGSRFSVDADDVASTVGGDA